MYRVVYSLNLFTISIVSYPAGVAAAVMFVNHPHRHVPCCRAAGMSMAAGQTPCQRLAHAAQDDRGGRAV